MKHILKGKKNRAIYKTMHHEQASEEERGRTL